MIGIPVEVTSSTVGLKICAIAAGLKKHKSIIKKKEKKHNKIVLLPKCKLYHIEALISKALIDSFSSHYDFTLVNNVLKHMNK